jgi:GNAT superfamily N-acetyltransferase
LTSLQYLPAALDDSSLEQALRLMQICFPKAGHYSMNFLSWLYRENPTGEAVGFNTFDGSELVGHLVGIPQRVRLHGQPATAIVFLNVATHPDYRGKGIFLELARRTADRARNLGYSAILGVANQNTISGYEKKLGWQNVAGLDARISLNSESIEMPKALDGAQLCREWDQETIIWRMRNPANSLRPIAATPDQIVFQGATSLPGIKIRGAISREGLDLGSALPRKAWPAPTLQIGLQPEGTVRRGLSLPIPDWAKPSPLRLIYNNLKKPDDCLDPKAILFSFLDFDAF